MTAPAELPVWATDNTNNGEPSSGQKNSGWAVNQFIVSSYFNWWMNLVYQWINYLSSGVDAGWHDQTPVGVPSAANATFANGRWTFGTGVSASYLTPIAVQPRVGEVITDVRVKGGYGSFNVGSGEFVVTFYKTTGNGSPTSLHAFDLSSTADTATTSFTLSSPETVVDGTTYYFDVQCTGVGTGGFHLASVGHKIGA